MTPNEPHSRLSVGRFLPMSGALVVAVSLVGFLIGIGDTAAPERVVGVTDSATPRTTASPAPTYEQIAEAKLSPNAAWSGTLGDLVSDSPGLFAPVIRTPEMKEAAIADRARNRAFDSAPPVIPHPVTQQSAASCLACHGKGLKIGDRVATPVSHQRYSSCTQCHVEATRSAPFGHSTTNIENDFTGLYRAGSGSRAQIGSPPTIPHQTWLREDCLSCHGVIARPGLRTTHPWLSNCVQCHAADAGLNQSPAAK